MKKFKTKSSKLSGTDFKEVHKKVLFFYKGLKKNTKRRPYVRSAYFNNDKIFLELFWTHLFEKENWRDRVRCLQYFPPAIELIKNSRFDPASKENPNKSSEILHRFHGITRNNNVFFVQIKEDKRTSEKWLMSVFPN